MPLNGHPPTEDPELNPGDSPPVPGTTQPKSGNSEPSPLPGAEPQPIQLAFGFDLAPQPEGKKVPWLKRLQQEGLECYWHLWDKLINDPPDWEKRFWGEMPARKREWYKKVMYITWASTPKDARKPRTQKEFAKMIGVTPAAIWKWRTRNPEIEEIIKSAPLIIYEEQVQEVDYVTYYQAKQPDSSPAARKLFYDRGDQLRAAQMPFDLKQAAQLNQIIISNIPWDKLSAEQTERIAAGEHPLVVLASGVGVGNGLSG